MKLYIGDSVYAEVSDGALVLTTDNGFGPTNTIILESEVWHALKLFVKRVEEEFENAKQV